MTAPLFAQATANQLDSPPLPLYEQDYYRWLEITAQLLRTRQLSDLDIVHLADEIKAMGKREKRSVESNAEVILMHLLEVSIRSNPQWSMHHEPI
jgi:hypothetical protein